jgi:hypothetical protein
MRLRPLQWGQGIKSGLVMSKVQKRADNTYLETFAHIFNRAGIDIEPRLRHAERARWSIRCYRKLR